MITQNSQPFNDNARLRGRLIIRFSLQPRIGFHFTDDEFPDLVVYYDDEEIWQRRQPPGESGRGE